MTVNSFNLDFDDWKANYFIDAASLTDFFKHLQQLIGRTIDAVLTMGCIFYYDNKEGDKGYLNLDETVVILIEGLQFEVWFYTDSRVKIGFNTLTLKEKSYQPYDWRDVSSLFADDVIGQRIVGITVDRSSKGFYDSMGLGERPDGGDYIAAFSLTLENGKSLLFKGDIEHMLVYAGNRHGYWLYIESEKLYFDYDDCRSNGSDFMSFYPGKIETDHDHCITKSDMPHSGVHIFEEDFYELLTAIYSVLPDFDMYTDTIISKNDWRRIMDAWNIILEEESIEEMYKKLLGTVDENKPLRFMLNEHGDNFINKIKTDGCLFAAFENWLEQQLQNEDFISVAGF